jgi:hypothetical protein
MGFALRKTFLTCLLACSVVSVASDAAAQTGSTSGTSGYGALSWASDFTWYLQRWDPDGKQWIQLNATEQKYYFNRARCECDADKTNLKGSFRVAVQNAQNTADKIRYLLNQNAAGGSGTVRLFAGGNIVNCLTPNAAVGGAALGAYCVNLLDPSNLNAEVTGGMATIAAGRVWYSNAIPVAWLFNAVTNPVCSGSNCDSTASCDTSSATINIYFWAQTTSGQTPDMTDASFPVNLVGQSAFVPDSVSATGGNEALTVSWKWPNDLSPSGNAAFLGVQIFCVRGADVQVFKDKTFGASYLTAPMVCPNIKQATSTGIDALDPNYLCSGLLPSTTNSYRITGLQNDITYRVGVAAIDRYNNASIITDLVDGMPVATVDFYSAYKNAGGAAQGGYCSLARGQRTPAIFALAGLAAVGLLLGRRRRRRRGPGAGLLALALVGGSFLSGQARAQAVYHDDMVIENQAPAHWRGTPRDFAIEARFGLYTPAVDSEFSGDGTKPQSYIFGNSKRPMWQLEYDWEILQVFGTFAVGGVIGYYKENNGACTKATSTPKVCDRTTGDNTSLRLIPLAVLAIYRFDVLAEFWKIPLVPYGKVGLNYTLWNVTDGNGYTPTTPGGGKGKGGTAGWQAAVGISLQLDFLDPSAARGFDADSGVNHTYAFFELATIQSSGLGGQNKLHVGDNTWFAGLMFEF